MLRLHAHVWIGPHKIERHLWHRVRPNPGVELAIRVVPQGDGGGKNPLRIFLMVAVMALSIAAPYIGGSEEHTSELQSLMRISYAVFCLKKKKEQKRKATLDRTR